MISAAANAIDTAAYVTGGLNSDRLARRLPSLGASHLNAAMAEAATKMCSTELALAQIKGFEIKRAVAKLRQGGDAAGLPGSPGVAGLVGLLNEVSRGLDRFAESARQACDGARALSGLGAHLASSGDAGAPAKAGLDSDAGAHWMRQGVDIQGSRVHAMLAGMRFTLEQQAQRLTDLADLTDSTDLQRASVPDQALRGFWPDAEDQVDRALDVAAQTVEMAQTLTDSVMRRVRQAFIDRADDPGLAPQEMVSERQPARQRA